MEKIEDITYRTIVYEAQPELDRNCTGCAFNNDYPACEDANERRSSPCSVIWIKKESKVNSPELLATDKQEGVKYDTDKTKYSLIPPLALEAIAKNLTAGLSKYPRDNWKHVENAEERYLDALYRHLEAHRRGELYDTESSLKDMPHMSAVAANAMFLLEFIFLKNKPN